MKRLLLRIAHAITGHPTDQVRHGSPTEGNVCLACGARETIVDYYA